MSKTDLFKLIFHHDQRMEKLAPSTMENDNPLAMFTQPDPTFSTLYFSGTVLEDSRFGLNNLFRFAKIISILEQAFDVQNLREVLDQLDINHALLVDQNSKEITKGEFTEGKSIRTAIENNGIVLFKRENQHGFDLKIFSKENIYLRFFHDLQSMLEPGFRFFSINGKRVHNEEFFFFETHRLNNPPHGFEEVFPESVL